ncbi:MAG: hypothetical protein ACTHN5_11035 [Phycisphaerae bacterium]
MPGTLQFFVWFKERKRWVPASTRGAAVMSIDQGRPIKLGKRPPRSPAADDAAPDQIQRRIDAERARHHLQPLS